jgi:hypothetical protein
MYKQLETKAIRSMGIRTRDLLCNKEEQFNKKLKKIHLKIRKGRRFMTETRFFDHLENRANYKQLDRLIRMES